LAAGLARRVALARASSFSRRGSAGVGPGHTPAEPRRL